MNWWQCPRCGTRLVWGQTVITCPRERCSYQAKVPSTTLPADKDHQ